MKLHVGTSYVRGSFTAHLGPGLDLLEVRARPGLLPKLSKVDAMCRALPANTVLSVVLDGPCWGEGNQAEAAEAALVYAEKAIEIVRPGWVVLRSPPTFRPSAGASKRLGQVVERFRNSARRIAWEPQGLWQPSQARSLSKELGIGRVQQATEFEPEPFAYVRLLQLGARRHSGEWTAESLAEELLQCEEATVVIEGGRASSIAQLLRGLLDSELLDSELEEGPPGDWAEDEPDESEEHQHE